MRWLKRARRRSAEIEAAQTETAIALLLHEYVLFQELSRLHRPSDDDIAALPAEHHEAARRSREANDLRLAEARYRLQDAEDAMGLTLELLEEAFGTDDESLSRARHRIHDAVEAFDLDDFEGVLGTDDESLAEARRRARLAAGIVGVDFDSLDGP